MDFDPKAGARELKAIGGSTWMVAVSRRMRFDGWKCSWCRDPVPLHRRADAHFCGEGCRKNVARWRRRAWSVRPKQDA